jgi:hypothetical protein
MKMSVLTRSYDNARTGANTQESVLTPDAVGTRGIAKLFTVHVNDDARGAEAQPLLFADLKMADGSVRDVLYVCSMGNHILAFDANDGTPLWAHPPFLGSPVKNIPGGQPNAGNIDIKFINPNWGILSTPVIDSETETMYVINWTSPETDPQKSLAHSTHQLFAINIVDGTIRRAPLTIAGSVKNAKGDTIPFVSAAQKQRAALLLAKVKDSTGKAHKTLFMACGAVRETARNAHGWVLAFDIEKFSLVAAFCATRKSQGGGIWQGAQGPCADDQGHIYFTTGNGGWDGKEDFAESVCKLKYTPAEGGNAARLDIVDWFTPFIESTIRGADGHTVVVQGRKFDNTNHRGYDWGDQDLGSGGPVVLGDLGLVVACGKDGILYVLDENNFGKTQIADLQTPANNYKKLKFQPIFFTFFPGFNVHPAPDDPRSLNVYFVDNKTHHLHGSPVYWHSPDHGPMLFCWGENQMLRAWGIQKDGTVTFLAMGHEVASLNCPLPNGGMPGGMLSVTANGNTPHSGVVWTLAPLNGDANSQVTAGVLRAYDATQFDTNGDGSKALRLLWNSDRWNIQFNHNKFNLPVICNGKIYVPTYDGTIDVYGLTPH